MIILGLHYGHDASISVIRDGEVLSYVEKERFNRVKHAIALDSSDVASALAQAGILLEEIDFAAVTSTQGIDYLFPDPANLRISADSLLPAHVILPSFHSRERFLAYVRNQTEKGCRVLEMLANNQVSHQHHALLRQYHGILSRSPEWMPSLEWFGTTTSWDSCTTSDSIERIDLSGILRSPDEVARSFFAPVSLLLFERAIPAYVVSHHFAHAAYAFFQSDYQRAVVLSHDGDDSGTYLGGMVYVGDGRKLIPIYPHRLKMGYFYESMADRMGFGKVAGPGKLMGLAGWGKPAFASDDFAGNSFDSPSAGDPEAFHSYCYARAEQLGYDLEPHGDPEKRTAPINADIAASAQEIFERTMLRAASLSHDTVTRNMGRTRNLVLSGGASLNCPTNSRIAAHSAFDRVFVPPGCADSGLSLGAALALYHCYLEQPKVRSKSEGGTCAAYLGATYGITRIEESLAACGSSIRTTPVLDSALAAAELIAANFVIGWFEGKSELGPRALGHRSILANATFAANSTRVNRIKGRECWRPFAPSVIAEEAKLFFSDCPIPSPHMTFNARVITDRLPAVTHVDGTARIQTVSGEAGEFHSLLRHLGRLTGIPVVLNTSFNGPGEPLIETPEDALKFFLASEIDVLVFPGYLVRRA